MNQKQTETTAPQNEVMNLEATLYHYHTPILATTTNQETSTTVNPAS